MSVLQVAVLVWSHVAVGAFVALRYVDPPVPLRKDLALAVFWPLTVPISLTLDEVARRRPRGRG